MRAALVAGGGVAGLAAGLALQRAGWRVMIAERAERLEPLGAALSLWNNAYDALKALGVLGAVERDALPFDRMLVGDAAGRPILGPNAVHGHALIVRRAVLQTALVGALTAGTLRLGTHIEVIAERTGVRIGGRTWLPELIVDAGGIHAGGGGTYCGYGGVLALSERVAGPGLEGLAAEYWGRDERFGLFELREGRRYWFYMRTRPGDAPAPMLHELSTRAKQFPDSVQRAVAATSASALIPVAVFAKSPPRRLGQGRVVQVGDAAHAMQPNLGQGACQALEDAVALGAVAHLPPDAILPAFEALRLQRVRRVVQRAAEGKFGAHGPRVVQFALRTALRLAPAALLEGMTRDLHTLPDYGSRQGG